MTHHTTHPPQAMRQTHQGFDLLTQQHNRLPWDYTLSSTDHISLQSIRENNIGLSDVGIVNLAPSHSVPIGSSAMPVTPVLTHNVEIKQTLVPICSRNQEVMLDMKTIRPESLIFHDASLLPMENVSSSVVLPSTCPSSKPTRSITNATAVTLANSNINTTTGSTPEVASLVASTSTLACSVTSTSTSVPTPKPTRNSLSNLSGEENTDDTNIPQAGRTRSAERMRQRRCDPKFRAADRARSAQLMRLRRQDPEFRKAERARSALRMRLRRHNDPEFRAADRARSARIMRARRQDPAFRERERARNALRLMKNRKTKNPDDKINDSGVPNDVTDLVNTSCSESSTTSLINLCTQNNSIQNSNIMNDSANYEYNGYVTVGSASTTSPTMILTQTSSSI